MLLFVVSTLATGRQSYLELREEIAHKFDCKPVQVLQVFKVGGLLNSVETRSLNKARLVSHPLSL